MPIRILIADDNASVRTAMRQVLQATGEHWEIIEAENGQETVAKAQELRPNLIIVDLVMPLMDGLSAARQITQQMPETPILMHTLYPFPRVKVEAGKVGVRKVVPKSDSRVLVSAVEDLLSLPQPECSPAPAQSSSPDVVTSTRRTEDKIRELCSQLFSTKDDEGHATILVDLQKVLHQHIEQLRARVAEFPVAERRVRHQTRHPDPRAQEEQASEPTPPQPGPIAVPATVRPQKGPARKTSTG